MSNDLNKIRGTIEAAVEKRLSDLLSNSSIEESAYSSEAIAAEIIDAVISAAAGAGYELRPSAQGIVTEGQSRL